MRKSKSNPAKYTRNYRKVSQRHMTGYGDETNTKKSNSDEKEQKRLESVLKDAETTWKRGLCQLNEDESLLVGGKRKRGAQSEEKDAQGNEEGMLSLLSPELREQFAGMESLVILPSGTKKKNRKKELPPLTPAEIKAAKALYKNTQRKLAQLEQRRKQKELRSGLYKELEDNALLAPTATSGGGEDACNRDKQDASVAVSNKITQEEAQSLLMKSSELGKRLSKKQKLKQIRQKEALGLKLTQEERNLLYVKYDAPDDEAFPGMDASNDKQVDSSEKTDGTAAVDSGSKTKKRKKQKMKSPIAAEKIDGVVNIDAGKESDETNEAVLKKAKFDMKQEVPPIDYVKETDRLPVAENIDTKISSSETTSDETKAPEKTLSSASYAQMMFAGLSSLKTKTDSKNVELAEEKARKQQEAEEEAMRLEEEMRKKRKVYIPSETIKVSTMHRLDATVDDASTDKSHRVLVVSRPADVKESRYDLPVSSMEFEIIDAVRSNDCTILCGETGSGKSTQVPQFLFEAGFSIQNTTSDTDSEQQLLIGITQPRRVAAVSTAKRVCYEMGHGDGQTIRSARGKDGGTGNLVAYQTRYETAGLGSATHIKFMTDGILLQEIQSDLLLRKYGAIVIDEAHERNLNTDVLLGLLSVALPLRRKAAAEGSLPPLKLVIMSATLRVEDFTENTRLFPKDEDGVARQPALVKVPGRTFPVSIHHSKVTELDGYEKIALGKTCKIHRKLPHGGILVFLTGKQEVVRMVNKLRQKLEPRDKKKENTGYQPEIFNECETTSEALDGYRDMDDEEMDGDIFQKEDEIDDFEEVDVDDDVVVETVQGNGQDKQPKKVRILPLYSMLSPSEQAKVFAPVPDDTRLIVVATNIAETSITIPGISYVVDSGRQKCRNYHSGTGVSSYDVMWISKAAADQRAGRAGRTGPGHCYRLYSSSVYSRYLDSFAMPEVLTRPLEDVVLAMKTMNVSSVENFPFPTPPQKNQISSAVRLLANLGCIDVSMSEKDGGDGQITTLGAAVAKLPVGVRYGKMLLVSAQANVLDYGIALVAALSESNPFLYQYEEKNKDENEGNAEDALKGLDEVDRNNSFINEKKNIRALKSKWMHDGGDVLSAMMAAGAYSFAGRGAGGASEKAACRNFCEENGLNLVVMQRIAKMRLHLCKLAQLRLQNAEGVAVETGAYLPSMPPPNRAQECLLRQVIASGLLDNVARRAPPGILSTEFTGIPRSAYMCGNGSLREPLFLDNNSAVHSKLPEWVCFDSVVRKKKRDGTTVLTMQRVTPIDAEFLASLCHGSNLLTLGSPLATPLPRYNGEEDAIQCAVETKFGSHSWQIPPLYVGMYEMLQSEDQCKIKKQNPIVVKDDSFRWFGRLLLEGKVLTELSELLPLLNDEPVIITRRKPQKKVTLFVSELSNAGIDSARALQKHWAEFDDKFLFRQLKSWVRADCVDEAKAIWIRAVKTNINIWRRLIA